MTRSRKKKLATEKLIHSMSLLDPTKMRQDEKDKLVKYKRQLNNIAKECIVNERKLRYWIDKLENKKVRARENTWNNVVRNISMFGRQGIKDTTTGLEKLSSAIKEADFSLISEETRFLLESHGIDLRKLKTEIQSNSTEAITNLEGALKDFSMLNPKNIIRLLKVERA